MGPGLAQVNARSSLPAWALSADAEAHKAGMVTHLGALCWQEAGTAGSRIAPQAGAEPKGCRNEKNPVHPGQPNR